MIRKKRHMTAVITSLIILSGVVFFIIYLNIFYHASEDAKFLLNNDSSIIYQEEESAYMIVPEKMHEVGIIFYPGAKVEEVSYLPLLKLLAEKGYYCVCIKMPFRMAVFGVNAAQRVIDEHSEISKWYLMGHSLGGAMASSYAKENGEQLEGLILLAAYSADDLTAANFRVLSIYGSNDRVLDLEKQKKNKKNLPDDSMEAIIEGGNHAWFGNYGEQKGDGIAQITREEVQRQTRDIIVSFIEDVENK